MSKMGKEVDALIRSVIEKSVSEGIRQGYAIGKQESKDYFRQTEKRLRAYPELKKNIEKYEKDIADLQYESRIPGSKKSKDIARMISNGVRLSPEEILGVKIANIEIKKKIDEAEIVEIDYALDGIRGEYDYNIIEWKYFEYQSDEEIAQKLHCDERTVRRNKNRLVSKIMIRLYGAACQ